MKKNVCESRHPRLDNQKWLKRIAWLIAIWSASVAALGVVALLLKALMTAAGMSS
jgi:hypothetical protein